MWTYLGKRIKEGRAWQNADGIQHPTSWGRWSDDEKVAAGLVFVADPTPFDNRFYSDANTPKALDDVNAVDEDGNAILDEDGVQVVTLGLKSQWKATIKQQAGGLLEPTDWYVTRNAETGEAIPSSVSQYRAAVRTASGNIEAAIDAAANHTAFVALFDAPEDGKAPIADWPDEV